MKNSVKEKCAMAFTGALTGVANGLFGGGGGMIAVPLMTYFMKMKTKVAHATALLVILPITVVSAIVYIVSGRADFSIVLPISIGVTAGGAVGALLLSKLKPKIVVKIFAVVMLAAGVKLLFF